MHCVNVGNELVGLSETFPTTTVCCIRTCQRRVPQIPNCVCVFMCVIVTNGEHLRSDSFAKVFTQQNGRVLVIRKRRWKTNVQQTIRSAHAYSCGVSPPPHTKSNKSMMDIFLSKICLFCLLWLLLRLMMLHARAYSYTLNT